jgi:hypothetical protein
VGKEFTAQAEGPTKKAAEQEAARLALLHYRELDGQAEGAAAEQAAAPEGQARPPAESEAAPVPPPPAPAPEDTK